MESGTPSAQVRIPVGDLVLPPPPTYAHTILLGEKISGGGKIMRWRNFYPGRARVAKNQKNLTVPKIVAQCRKYPIPNLNTLRDRSISLYINKNTILIHCRNYTLS